MTMGKFLFVIISWIFIVSVLMFSCRQMDNSEESSSWRSLIKVYRITGVELRPLDKEQIGETTNYYHSDTLRNQLVLEIRTSATVIDSIELEEQEGGDEPIPGKIVNPTVCCPGVLTFDKPIQIDGVSLEAGQNLLTMQNRDNYVLFPFFISPFTVKGIYIKEEYFAIPAGDYVIYAEWITNEQEQIGDSVRVYIDID